MNGDPANLTDPLGLVAAAEYGTLTGQTDAPKAGVAGARVLGHGSK